MRRMETEPRRWTGRPRHALLWDVAVFGVWFGIVAVFLLAVCAIAWVTS